MNNTETSRACFNQGVKLLACKNVLNEENQIPLRQSARHQRYNYPTSKSKCLRALQRCLWQLPGGIPCLSESNVWRTEEIQWRSEYGHLRRWSPFFTSFWYFLNASCTTSENTESSSSLIFDRMRSLASNAATISFGRSSSASSLNTFNWYIIPFA